MSRLDENSLLNHAAVSTDTQREKENRVKKILFALALAGAFACIPVSAQTVEVFLLSSAPESCPLRLPESVLDGVLDQLFEFGMMGMDVRPKAASRDEFLAWLPNAETLGEYVDRVLLVWVSFLEDGSSWKLAVCEYRYMDNSGKELTRGTVKPLVPPSSLLDDIVVAGKKTGMILATQALGL